MSVNPPIQSENEPYGGAPLVTESELGSHSEFEGRSEAMDIDIDSSMRGGQFEKMKDLHPYSQILSLADIDSCVSLEDATFPPDQRCSREKFKYRLTKCSELSLGLFTSTLPGSEHEAAATASTARPPDSTEPERRGMLLAHIIATRTQNEKVADGDMAIPSSERSSDSPTLGHDDHGRTIAVHSLAVLPAYQKRGLGATLMKAYVQRMAEAGIADRISLITYDRLIPFYEKLGFESKGASTVQFGGGNWNDMVLDFNSMRAPMSLGLLHHDDDDDDFEE